MRSDVADMLSDIKTLATKATHIVPSEITAKTFVEPFESDSVLPLIHRIIELCHELIRTKAQ